MKEKMNAIQKGKVNYQNGLFQVGRMLQYGSAVSVSEIKVLILQLNFGHLQVNLCLSMKKREGKSQEGRKEGKRKEKEGNCNNERGCTKYDPKDLSAPETHNNNNKSGNKNGDSSHTNWVSPRLCHPCCVIPVINSQSDHHYKQKNKPQCSCHRTPVCPCTLAAPVDRPGQSCSTCPPVVCIN